MKSSMLNLLYIGLVASAALSFAYFMSKDAKKFLGGHKNLSKIHNSILYALSYINENMLDNGRFVYTRNLKNKYISRYYTTS